MGDQQASRGGERGRRRQVRRTCRKSITSDTCAMRKTPGSRRTAAAASSVSQAGVRQQRRRRVCGALTFFCSCHALAIISAFFLPMPSTLHESAHTIISATRDGG